MALPIISAEERLREKHSAKIGLVGPPGVGKTSQLKTLPPEKTLFVDLEAGDLAVKDWPGDTVRPRTWGEFRDRMTTALEQRYGETARTALVESGRDFGVTHFADGPLRISYELPKRVTWDQKRLSDIVERISASGERVQDYIDVELSVSESRFNGWPPVLKEQFEGARTVKAGKAKFVLELNREDA